MLGNFYIIHSNLDIDSNDCLSILYEQTKLEFCRKWFYFHISINIRRHEPASYLVNSQTRFFTYSVGNVKTTLYPES